VLVLGIADNDPNGRLLLVCGDGTRIVIRALRNRRHGVRLGFEMPAHVKVYRETSKNPEAIAAFAALNQDTP
jgi:hypothetical protein